MSGQWLLEQLVPTALIATCGFVVAFLRKIGNSIASLNIKMAVFVEKITAIAEHVDDHEVRIREIELEHRPH